MPLHAFGLFLLAAITQGCAQTNDEQRFALGIPAIMTERWRATHDQIALYPYTEQTRARTLKGLGRDWGVSTTEELRSLLGRLHAPEPVKTRRAWNLVRAAHVVRAGLQAGLLTEERAWPLLLSSAALVKKDFSSWQDLQWNYVLGRREWDPNPGEVNQYTHWVYRKLLLDPKGPWRRAPWRDDSTFAALTVYVRPGGLTCLSLIVPGRRFGASWKPEMDHVLGCDATMLYEKQSGEDTSIGADCVRKTAPPEFMTEYRLPLDRLSKRLQAEGVNQLHLTVQQIPAGDLSVFPKPDYAYPSEPDSQIATSILSLDLPTFTIQHRFRAK